MLSIHQYLRKKKVAMCGKANLVAANYSFSDLDLLACSQTKTEGFKY